MASPVVTYLAGERSEDDYAYTLKIPRAKKYDPFGVHAMREYRNAGTKTLVFWDATSDPDLPASAVKQLARSTRIVKQPERISQRDGARWAAALAVTRTPSTVADLPWLALLRDLGRQGRRWWEDPRWRNAIRARAERTRPSTPRSLRTVRTERARLPLALRVLTTPTHGPPLAHAEPGGVLSVT